MIHELYQNRKKRDERASQLKGQGYTVKRGSIRNQLLHPQYVEDFVGPEKDETLFSVLYIVVTFPK